MKYGYVKVSTKEQDTNGSSLQGQVDKLEQLLP